MNDSKRYLKKIRAILPVWGSYEKRFYKDIRSNVTEFCMAHPDYTYSDLEHEFTSPEEIVKGVLKASPFAGAESTVIGVVEPAQAFAGFGVVCHVSFPPSELS